MKVKRAIVSVSDKTGLVELARGLVELDVELISTSGTADALARAGLPVTRVDELTGFPEMLGGRVRTLHPAILAGVLARRDHKEDMDRLAETGILPIDLVVSNLYPFRAVTRRRGVSPEEAIEMIDVGGPTLVRAAAKNHAHVGVIVEPDRYDVVLEELQATGGELSPESLRDLAAEAFAHTAGYDAAIAGWFAELETFPDRIFIEYVRVRDLPYGENPHQRAAYYVDASARRDVLSRVGQVQGNPLSFNNIADLSAARKLITEFALPSCVIVKHGNPCGAALAASAETAYANALACDPRSAFGGVVVLNRPVTEALARRIIETFTEIVFAPSYDEGAIGVFSERESMRVLVNQERRQANPGERDLRRVLGGALIQDEDAESEDRSQMRVATTRHPTEAEWGDVMFAWRIAKHVRSNAIVIARDLATVGIGAGQMSRIDSTRLALGKALSPVAGAVLASDAFFPFADGVDAALEAGIRVFVQPGGAKRDDEVLTAVEDAGGAMVLTGRRHFAH
jgi:phosphoribosylaminoimidazolecarboxamide formyltransferase/IMP cyclohydrolase